MHLDLTGRDVPLGREIQSRRYVVGNMALPAAFAYRHARATRPPIVRSPPGGVERAWLAADDPLPGLLTAIRSAPRARVLMNSDARRGAVGYASERRAGTTDAAG
jgi:hypothetical protein